MSAPFMQLYVADYLGDTRHLTTEQHGAYLLLLMTMWRSDGRLPNDDKKLARIASCTPSRWAKIRDEVMEFFVVEGDEITNPRLMFELKKASEKSIKRAEAGTKGGRAKALKNKAPAKANASRLPKHSSEPEPEIEEAKASLSTATPTKVRSYPEEFEAAWKAYPHARARSSKPESLSAWRRLPDGERQGLAAACERYRREGREPRMDCGAPAMERWIKRSLHQHWLAPQASRAATQDGPVDPAVQARRMRRYADTGVWELGWGPMPPPKSEAA